MAASEEGMLYLALAILASVSVAATIKVSETAGRNRVSVALVNYCIAACFIFVLWIVRGGAPCSGATLACGIYAGVTWVVSLILMMYAMKLIGIAITSAMVRIAVVLPVLLSVFVWSEIPGLLQVAGIALAGLAIMLLSLKVVRKEKRFHWPHVLLVAGVWLAAGAAQLASKLFAEACPEGEKDSYLVVLFLVAFAVTWLWLKLLGRTVKTGDFAYGAAVGVPNALSGFFLVSALHVLPGIVVFPTTAAAGVLLTVLLGLFIWKEKLGTKGIIGIATAIAALVLVNLKG
jgi:drug/metabolite transporter (DMT)-like permease